MDHSGFVNFLLFILVFVIFVWLLEVVPYYMKNGKLPSDDEQVYDEFD